MMHRRFISLSRNQAGVALIEFALILPILILLFIGVVEISRYILINQKVDKANSTMADLTAQTLNVTDEHMRLFTETMPRFTRPYEFSGDDMVIFTFIEKHNQVVNGQEQDTPAKITRQYSTTPGGVARSKLGSVGQNAILPPGFNMLNHETTWASETYYDFTPLLTQELLPPLELYKVAFTRPRLSQRNSCDLACLPPGETLPDSCEGVTVPPCTPPPNCPTPLTCANARAGCCPDRGCEGSSVCPPEDECFCIPGTCTFDSTTGRQECEASFPAPAGCNGDEPICQDACQCYDGVQCNDQSLPVCRSRCPTCFREDIRIPEGCPMPDHNCPPIPPRQCPGCVSNPSNPSGETMHCVKRGVEGDFLIPPCPCPDCIRGGPRTINCGGGTHTIPACGPTCQPPRTCPTDGCPRDPSCDCPPPSACPPPPCPRDPVCDRPPL